MSGELDTAIDLLDLLEHASRAVPQELSLGELTRAALGIGAQGSGGEDVQVRVDTEDASCVLLADAHVVSSLLAAAVARVRSEGARDIVLRARCEPREVSLTVSAAGASSRGTVVPARVRRRIPPTDAAVEAAARAVGGRLRVGGGAVVLTLPRA